MKKRGKGLLWVLGALVMSLSLCGVGRADVEIKELSNVFDQVLVGGDLHLFYRYTGNPYFGAPIGTTNEDDSSYGEILAKLRFTAIKNLGWTTLESQIGGVFLGTIDRDFYSGMKDEFDVDLDTGYMKFGKLFNAPVDITLGMQYIELEKWFVVASARGQDAAQWLAFHHSFPLAARVDLFQESPLKITAFWARTEKYTQQLDEWDPDVSPVGKDDVEAAGINFHLDIVAESPRSCLIPPPQIKRTERSPFPEFKCSNFYIYGGYFRKIDDSDLMLPNFTPDGLDRLSENNTNAFDIGFDATFGGLNLEGELVYETGDAGQLGDQDLDRDAWGGFAGVSYTLDVPYKPYLRARYIYYSGDSDLEDDQAEDYDPMFSGFLTWQMWILGEMAGEAQLPNTNKRVIHAEVGFNPRENVKVSFAYLRNELDESYYGIPYAGRIDISSRDWSDEFNLFTDVDINKNLFAHFGLGYAIPDDAAEEVFGDDDHAFFGQVWLWFKF